MKRAWERYWPVLFGIAVTAVFCYARHSSWIETDLKAALSAVTTVGAIAIGFLATAKSILISIKDTNPFVKGLQENGALYTRLLEFTRDALHWCFVNVIVSALALFVSSSQSPDFYHGVIFLVVFTGATGGAYCYRIMRHFFVILNIEG